MKAYLAYGSLTSLHYKVFRGAVTGYQEEGGGPVVEASQIEYTEMATAEILCFAGESLGTSGCFLFCRLKLQPPNKYGL